MKNKLIILVNTLSLIVIVTFIGAKTYEFFSEKFGDVPTHANASPVVIRGTPVFNESSALLENEKNSIQIFDQSKVSVVHVTNNRFYRDFFSSEIATIEQGTGTGIILDNSGLVITNYHVISSASQVMIKFLDGSIYEAKVVGFDPGKDLALLRVDAPQSLLVPIQFGNSDNLMVGQKVLAIGNPFGFDHTLTVGIVSALKREISSPGGTPIRGAIQTDAAINPGNSGGPLLNSSGQLIGINTQILSPSGTNSGIGFAIPINKVRQVIPMLLKYGKVARPYVGIRFLDDSVASYYNIKGVVIRDVVPGSPAERAGIKGISANNNGGFVLGDIIVKINNTLISNSDDFLLELEQFNPGDEITVESIRDKKSKKLKVTLGDLR